MSGTGAPTRHQEPGVAAPAPRRLRADLGFAVVVLSLLAVGGLLLGLLWSRLAPVQWAMVLPDGGREPLPGQSGHRFDDLAVFLLLGIAAGALAGAALWLLLRSRRGPVALLVLTAGSALSGWLALRLGTAVAPAGPVVPPGALTTLPAVLESGWVLLAQPLGAALVYLLAAAWNGRPDLGRPGS